MTTNQKSNFFSRLFTGRFTIVIVLGLLIGGGGYAYWQTSSQNAADSANGSPLQTTAATVGNLVLYADGTGTVTPAAETSFGFNTSGQVSEIYVKVGDQVQAGDVLAKLDDTYAQIELAKAQEAMNALTSSAALATANQSLAEAQTDFAPAKENS